MTHSSASKESKKPAKPRPDFPLFPHATGRWAKKIKGKLHYFGPWADPDAALARYVEERDDLYAGRKPRRKGEGLRVKDLVNRFLIAKKARVDAGELALGTFGDQYKTCKRVLSVFGGDRLVDDLAQPISSQRRSSIRMTIMFGRCDCSPAAARGPQVDKHKSKHADRRQRTANSPKNA